MKKLVGLFFLFIIFISVTAEAQGYQSQNITLLANWNDTGITYIAPPYSSRYSGIWGYVDTANGKEYGIIGSQEGYHFIEVSNPSTPVERDFIAGRRDSCLWREIKTFGHYAYMISQDGYGFGNSFIIADLSYLPDSVHVVHDDTTIFTTAHAMWVDGNKLYCSNVHRGSAFHSGMAVYSLTNAAHPTLLRAIEDDYPSLATGCSHDMFVRNDTVYASCQYSGLEIFKFTSSNTFSQLASLTTYPGNGYNHSTALTPDGKTLILCDEVPVGLPIKSLDVSNLGNIAVLDTFRSTPNSRATPHNPFIRDNNRVVLAYYEDGVQIFDISNPSNPVRTGFFDTDTISGAANNWALGYHGCWGAYPFLPSGIILASDMQNGMYVLDGSVAMGTGTTELQKENVSFKAYPNPAKDFITIEINNKGKDVIQVSLQNILGQQVFEKNNLTENKFRLPLYNLNNGIYFIKINSGDNTAVQKILISN